MSVNYIRLVIFISFSWCICLFCVFILQTEIASHEPRIRAVCDNGVQMIDNGELTKTVLFLDVKSLPYT